MSFHDQWDAIPSAPKVEKSTDAEWRAYYETICREQRKEISKLELALSSLANGIDKDRLPSEFRKLERLNLRLSKEVAAWKAGFIASQPMIAYLRYVAGEHVEHDFIQEARDAEWDKMTPVERDMANRITEVVFGDYL